MDAKEKMYTITADSIIKNLEKRQIKGYYCGTTKQALELAMKLVEPGMTVSNGGSVTLDECGIIDTLASREDINFLDRRTAKSPDELSEILHRAYFADVYFMSTNAITLDGILVNIDGTGGRTSCLIYGPHSVIIVAGMNKVVTDVEEGYKRVKNIASPPNAIRLGRKTPCAATGRCSDCLSPDCICSNTVITRRSAAKDRIKVILVGETLGY